MNKAVAEPRAGGPATLAAELDALRAAGGQDFAPVRFRYLLAMSERTQTLPQPAADVVATRALVALRRYRREGAVKNLDLA